MKYKIIITDEIIRAEIDGLEDVKFFSDYRMDIHDHRWDIIIENKFDGYNRFPYIQDIVFEIDVLDDKIIFSDGEKTVEITDVYVIDTKEYAFYFTIDGKEIELE
ncbi:MAG: hypothetical protein JHC31_10475 [Sulfurihydrogenibium sp.]|jgi:hypothetical protein|nr:hypothetical protein [Sulfurihydrogenibium sp.]